MTAVDPSTYTAAGANSSVIATSSTTVTVTSIQNGHEAYLSKDYGAGEIGDFELLLTFNVSADSGTPIYYPIGVSNTVGDFADLDTANDGIVVYANTLFGSTFLRIMDLDSSTNSSLADPLSSSTDYFLTFERSASTATLTIRTGSHSGTVVDTLTHTVSTDLFRYNFLSQSSGTSGTSTASYTLDDIDFDIGTPPIVEYTHLEFHRRIGVIES